jgi:hypothetical protein
MRSNCEIMIFLDVQKSLEGIFIFTSTFVLLDSPLHKHDIANLLLKCIIFMAYVDLFVDGMKLYLSDNNVLLTEGLNGIVPPSYFAKIETWPDRELIS